MSIFIKILHDGIVDSLTTMKRDLMLLSECEKSETTIFRTYMWDSPAISLGRLQRAEEILNLKKIQDEGIKVVQRPTGGRQILHGEDISFSLIIPLTHSPFWGNSVTERMKSVSTYISKAFSYLNIEIHENKKKLSRQSLITAHKSPCFLTTTPSELSYRNKKLVGIAQLVHKQGILIQGTIPFTDNHTLLPQYERIPDSQQDWLIDKLKNETSDLRNVLGAVPTYKEICSAFSQSFIQ